MKCGTLMLPVGALFFIMAHDAFGSCADFGFNSNHLLETQSDVVAALGDKRIKAEGGSIPGDNEWLEDHCLGGDIPSTSGGNLYKVGVAEDDPVDPRKQVGTWEVNGSGIVTYHYATVDYSWALYEKSSLTGGKGLCWESSKGVTVVGYPQSTPTGTCP